MFTGLIQGLGKISPLDTDRFALVIAGTVGERILADLAIGDSVAVDGVCLTVEEMTAGGFVATASPETLNRTLLGRQIQGEQWVNIETSLRVGSKLGGHFVTGHVDGIGCLKEAIATERSWEMSFTSPLTELDDWQQMIAPYIVPKGSIAVNGISLTIADCDPQGDWFKVAVIPHTYEETNLSYLKPGDCVNLEGDILGKYVDRLLAHRLGQNPTLETINLNFLSEHGYV